MLAFHLPQYHPIPENDEWWGKGFTEWTKVAKGRPLFPGHQQPHQPADLGYYDLRLPEVREQQADLARAAGIDGFVYYHYWFNGRRLLERPVNEILRLGRPDFPFCLCWANESWSRNWDGHNKQILMPQAHSAEDDARHIAWLLTAFADPRYIKIDGRPLFLIYRTALFPDIRRTAELWRREAQKAGFPDLYLCSVRSFPEELRDPAELGLDASVDFKPNCTNPGERLASDNPVEVGYRLHRVFHYDQLVRTALRASLPGYAIFPSVTPSWDNSVRRHEGGVIFAGATPDKYRDWLQEVLIREHFRPQRDHLVFINAWNEWAEGNHLEPCERWGHGYLTATREAKTNARAFAAAITWSAGDIIEAPQSKWLLSAIERFEICDSHSQMQGWCFWSQNGRPADLIVLAERLEGDRYRLLRPVMLQRLPRSDVAHRFVCDGPASYGWCDHGQDLGGRTADSLAVLA
ncbi:MAG TPA: glycoside hydrolase family 99-like domain-containing protein, partial [Phycisphaerae bacterium]|nr:glycoside hydrolase family 99-like domain-containing protein [Phycisphaerae bacterium]